MSIVRQGLAEDKKFGDGYEAIFGKKPAKAGAKKAAAKPAAATAEAPAEAPADAKKKPAPKKK